MDTGRKERESVRTENVTLPCVDVYISAGTRYIGPLASGSPSEDPGMRVPVESKTSQRNLTEEKGTGPYLNRSPNLNR